MAIVTDHIWVTCNVYCLGFWGCSQAMVGERLRRRKQLGRLPLPPITRCLHVIELKVCGNISNLVMVTKWGFRNLLQNWHQKLNQIIMRISVGGGTFWILHAGKGGARVLIGALRVRTLRLSWVNCELTIWICFTYSSQKKAISSTISRNLSEPFRDLIIWPFSLFPNRYATLWRHRNFSN